MSAQPGPEPYRSVASAFDVDVREVWLLAAHSWDVTGALSAGCQAAFVARPGMALSPIGPQQDSVGADIADAVGRSSTATPAEPSSQASWLSCFSCSLSDSRRCARMPSAAQLAFHDQMRKLWETHHLDSPGDRHLRGRHARLRYNGHPAAAEPGRHQQRVQAVLRVTRPPHGSPRCCTPHHHRGRDTPSSKGRRHERRQRGQCPLVRKRQRHR